MSGSPDAPASRVPFHVAFPVDDLEATRDFYAGALGARVGREAERWIDFDLFGHQLSAHLMPGVAALAASSASATNEVDGDAVPVRHFGAVLAWPRWESLAARLREHGVRFRIEPRIRFRGEVGEQGTFFVDDPSGNVLEFKTFRDPARLFAR
ncbi:MAG: VOC family protein [Planctomycetota bacterium]